MARQPAAAGSSGDGLKGLVAAAQLMFGDLGPPMLLLDRGGSVAWVNRLAQSGFAAGPGGRPLQRAGEFQPPQVAARLLSMLKEIGAPGYSPEPGVQVLGRAAGTELSACILVDETGTATGILVTSMGAGGSGEQGRIEDVGRMAGFMAHDFNNLLGGILGNASLALHALEPEHPAASNIRAVELAARRAADLAQQVLAYAGSQKVLYTPVDLNDIVNEMTGLLEVAIARKAMLRCNLGRGLPAIQANTGQVRQVVLNLIANAAEAIDGPDGQITVATGFQDCDEEVFQDCILKTSSAPGCFTWMEVSDNGGGIAVEEQSRIFEPFFTTKESGQGIGLAAVRSAVVQHGAALSLQSEPGSTTFRVYFPTAGGSAEQAEPSEVPRADAAVTGLVLVADDEEVIRLVAHQALAEKGFGTLVAADGKEALELFEANSESVSLLLLDVSMPRLNGVQVLEAVRKLKPEVPVILSSGFNEQEAARHYHLAKGTNFLQKPYLPETLLRKVREALDHIT